MKTYGYKCSILNRTTNLISSTSCNWARINAGALLKIGDYPEVYEVAYVDKLHIREPFIVKNRNTITVNKNLKPFILNNDTINIFHTEYELADSMIAEAGIGYRIGDLLTAKIDNQNENAVLEVTATNNNGEVTNYKILNRGQYNTPITQNIYFDTTGNGQDFQLIFTTSEKVNTSKLDRMCFNIIYDEKQTSISFVHQLPPTLKIGYLTLDKWQATLVKPFSDPRNIDYLNQSYKVYNEFTPNYQFPLMLPNQENIPEFMNAFFFKLDSILTRNTHE